MFIFHSSIMITLIALALGVGLIVWSLRNEGMAVDLAKGFGWFVVIVAILGSICASVYVIKYTLAGYFQTPVLSGEAFLFHVAQMLEIIAIGVGIILVAWALRNQGVGVLAAKRVGWIIVIVAILGLLCTSYYGIMYWSKGYFQSPVPMVQSKSMEGMNHMQDMQKMHKDLVKG